MSLRARGLAPAFLALLTVAGCKRFRTESSGGEIAQTWTPSAATTAKGVPTSAISVAIATHLNGKPPAPLSEGTWKRTQKLYASYKNTPLWFTESGLDKPRAGALMLAVADGNSDGLRLQDFPLPELGASIDTVSNIEKPTAEQLASLDVLLTATYVSLGEDLMTGQIDPATINQSWHISSRGERLDSALFQSIRADQLDKAIARMRPVGDGYDSLRMELDRYRKLAVAGFTKVPTGKLLKVGQSDSPERISALKSRLAEEGYLADTASAPVKPADTTKTTETRAVFTKTLSDAVNAFQSHHGIPVDGSLGDETVNSMNVPIAYRVSQIAANLERYRWMPRAFGDRYILVNVPAFKLVAYDSGKQVLEMKVIVGQEYEGKATPVFADTMQYVVFRPYWNVTPTIQEKEFAGRDLPEGFEYYTDGGQTRIRQRPGPKNALGLVKFLFPNDFNIYLHDTPNDELFKKDVRAFSHGCIRLEKPDELAQFVLGWDMDRVHQAMNEGGDNRTVELKRRIPVYITYFTTYVADGQLYFGNDLYHRDDSLVETMTPGALPSEDALRVTRALHTAAENWGVRDLNH
ncbi:MAG TPA: L,D-transpeptidase family protein [Gemmatimonadaceae bacterium]